MIFIRCLFAVFLSCSVVGCSGSRADKQSCAEESGVRYGRIRGIAYGNGISRPLRSWSIVLTQIIDSLPTPLPDWVWDSTLELVPLDKVRTDSSGHFVFEQLPPGYYHVASSRTETSYTKVLRDRASNMDVPDSKFWSPIGIKSNAGVALYVRVAPDSTSLVKTQQSSNLIPGGEMGRASWQPNYEVNSE